MDKSDRVARVPDFRQDVPPPRAHLLIYAIGSTA